MEEKAALCRHVKAVGEYMSREHEMGSVMERIIINANDDNDDDVSESKLVVTIMVIYKELVQSSVAASEVK